jgi:diaminopimelate decarboxylase
MTEQIAKLPLFPISSEVNKSGHLTIGGCDTVNLSAEFGTPLYVFDESTLLSQCTQFKTEFGKRYPETKINYACKAFINKTVLRMFRDEGLGLDVVSGGEIGYAISAGFPAGRIDFPGNNKSTEELTLALDSGIGHIVVDNFQELEMLGQLAEKKKMKRDILLRISPGVDPHTHQKISTGNIDSKFGVPMMQAEKAVSIIMKMPSVNPTGLHFHIGSQLTEIEPYLQSIEYILEFAADMKKKYGFELKELSIGGGYAVQYVIDAPAPPISYYAEALTSKIIRECKKLKMGQPRLIIEPGRSMVARAGVAVYTAGVVKDIPGVRHYVSVDGGMADNIRPTLYQAKQDAVVANKMNEKVSDTVTIAGKFCESGDVLITDIVLPPIKPGDIIAVAGCGAYCVPEAMNYNAFFKPAIVLVKDGKAKLIRRRETLEDLIRCDVD